MLKYYLTFFILFFASSRFFAITINDAKKLELPVVIVNTVNGEVPTCNYVRAPEGQDGISITDATKVKARMYIVFHNDTLYDSGNYEEDISGLTIKIRGNTSAYYSPMKPYKLKLQKKADLLLRDNKIYKDKDWLLLNDYHQNIIVGNKISELIGINWHPQYEYVNFFLNGKYQGLYFLSESMKRNPDCRINVTQDEGYLFEFDAYWWNEPIYAETNVLNVKYKYTFKYPDTDDITQTQVDYIADYMNSVETAIQDGTYPNKIDVESFAKWLLAHDILGTIDGGGSNMFLTKYDNSSKVFMSCPWDFSGIMNYNDYSSYEERWASIHTIKYWYFPYLLSNTNHNFLKTYINIWNSKKDSIFTEIDSFLENLATSPLNTTLNKSRKYTLDRWYYNKPEKYVDYEIEKEAEGMRQWFAGRKAWLEENIAQLSKECDSIEFASNTIYNIRGMRVYSPTYNGVYIINGKKYIKAK